MSIANARSLAVIVVVRLELLKDAPCGGFGVLNPWKGFDSWLYVAVGWGSCEVAPGMDCLLLSDALACMRSRFGTLMPSALFVRNLIIQLLMTLLIWL